ncbi:MAG TPA: hypothetical protein VMW10_09795 [Alphaproteobacteria bacterium]|nr:hypothetical protein [Alphaproteobacteria bacterium]
MKNSLLLTASFLAFGAFFVAGSSSSYAMEEKQTDTKPRVHGFKLHPNAKLEDLSDEAEECSSGYDSFTSDDEEGDAKYDSEIAKFITALPDEAFPKGLSLEDFDDLDELGEFLSLTQQQALKDSSPSATPRSAPVAVKPAPVAVKPAPVAVKPAPVKPGPRVQHTYKKGYQRDK